MCWSGIGAYAGFAVDSCVCECIDVCLLCLYKAPRSERALVLHHVGAHESQQASLTLMETNGIGRGDLVICNLVMMKATVVV